MLLNVAGIILIFVLINAGIYVRNRIIFKREFKDYRKIFLISNITLIIFMVLYVTGIIGGKY